MNLHGLSAITPGFRQFGFPPINMDTQDAQDKQNDTPPHRKRTRSMIGFVFEGFDELGSGFWNPWLRLGDG